MRLVTISNCSAHCYGSFEIKIGEITPRDSKWVCKMFRNILVYIPNMKFYLKHCLNFRYKNSAWQQWFFIGFSKRFQRTTPNIPICNHDSFWNRHRSGVVIGAVPVFLSFLIVSGFSTSITYNSFHTNWFASVVLRHSASSQPVVCIKIQIRRGGPNLRPGGVFWYRSASSGSVVPLMDICFGFSPSPPERYPGFWITLNSARTTP
jgi:hypothetical protein